MIEMGQVFLASTVLRLSWSECGWLSIRSQRIMQPTRLAIPARCVGFDVLALRVDNESVIAATCPAELFSEHAVGLCLTFPTLRPRNLLALQVQAPRRPAAPHWSAWRARSSARRRGLWVRQDRARPPIRHGLWFQPSRPGWLPSPRPELFQFAVVGNPVRETR